MTYRLKSHRMQIPNGFKFRQGETGWESPRYASFDTVVDSLIAHRRGNPHLAEKHGWKLDRDSVYAEVEAYNVRLCVANKWFDYLTNAGDPSPPKSTAHSLLQTASQVAVGASTLVDWLSSGAEAVPAEQSESRALVCVSCPLNQSGDISSFFTTPIAAAIQMMLNVRMSWTISTKVDEQLGVCQACSCPLKLMVHVPLATKLAKMTQESKDALWEGCWIRSEQK